jgi:hypothetical protein
MHSEGHALACRSFLLTAGAVISRMTGTSCLRIDPAINPPLSRRNGLHNKRGAVLAILDVVIGVVFMYLLLALLVSGINEWISGLFAMRAKTLRRAITRLVEAPAFIPTSEGKVETPPQPEPPGERTRKFYDHPKIAALADGKTPPSYIPPETFAEVVRDLGWHQPEAPPRDRARVAPVAVTTVAAAADARAAATDPLQKLFNDTMDRATGWYKRRVQVLTVVIGMLIVVLGNADTMQIANILWESPTLRAAVVQQAGQAVRSGSSIEQRVTEARYPTTNPIPPADEASAEEAESEQPAPTVEPLCAGGDEQNCQILQKLVGWGPDYKALNHAYCARLQAHRDDVCKGAAADPECEKVLDELAREARCVTTGGQLMATAAFPGAAFFSAALLSQSAGHLLGWLLTIAAISLGAPFWFDLLKNLTNVRNAGISPDDKKKQGAPA